LFNVEGFPFLIGRIRTGDFIQTGTIDAKFPFLIGRIRTNLKYLKKLKKKKRVSIPHR